MPRSACARAGAAAFLAIVSSLAACGGSTDGPRSAEEQAVGTYTLVAINGAPLPRVFAGSSPPAGSAFVNDSIIAGSLMLSADGSYAHRITVVRIGFPPRTVAPPQDIASSGVYRVQGGFVVISTSASAPSALDTHLPIRGDSVLHSGPYGVVWTYVRRR